MTTYEPDSEVMRWGYDLLHGDLFTSDEYYGTSDRSESSYYNEGYDRESSIGTDSYAIDDDEILARALQEEYFQLSSSEGSESSLAEDENFQGNGSDRFAPSVRSLSSGDEQDGEHPRSSSLCSSPGEELYEDGEWSVELLDDFSALDGEMGKRLNQMIPIPHVPRINGEIPSVDEATSDHERLLARLRLYDLVEVKVQGDGNCQFRALSDQFYHSSEHHDFVRRQVIDQLKSHPDIYEGYVPMAYVDYLTKLSKTGEWGDHVTLQAAADSYGVKIFVITSFKDTCYIEILPSVQKSNRVIFLSFWAEVHYNSIYPEDDLPASDSEEEKKKKKKKRWWYF